MDLLWVLVLTSDDRKLRSPSWTPPEGLLLRRYRSGSSARVSVVCFRFWRRHKLRHMDTRAQLQVATSSAPLPSQVELGLKHIQSLRSNHTRFKRPLVASGRSDSDWIEESPTSSRASPNRLPHWPTTPGWRSACYAFPNSG